MTIRPPDEESDTPTLTLTLPLTPLVALPECRAINPLLPLRELPDFKDNAPLVPDAVDNIVRKVKEPLDDDVSKPLVTLTAPPTDAAEPPADITTRPPFGTAEVAEPTDIVMLPEGPLLEGEDNTCKEPLLPLDTEPDEIARLPLTPEALDASVRIENDPLDDTDP